MPMQSAKSPRQCLSSFGLSERAFLACKFFRSSTSTSHERFRLHCLWILLVLWCAVIQSGAWKLLQRKYRRHSESRTNRKSDSGDPVMFSPPPKSGATRILSEDLNAGQRIAGILVENPFVGIR